MITLKLAFRNLIGAGLRTWLNVAVLSFAFVVIVFHKGILDGWNEQARRDTQAWEIGQGQLWHPKYDRYDPFSLQESHGKIPKKIESKISTGELTPLLITQATIYPQGRMESVLLKGIDPKQKILSLPSSLLRKENNDSLTIPAIIGKRMALSAGLKKGDAVLIRWRDKNGTFDAREVTVKGVFDSNVPTIDNSQIWIPLDKLQEMTAMTGEATILVAGKTYPGGSVDSWRYKDKAYLLKEIDEVIKAKQGSGAIIYFLLMAIALLAIFDTQILSIFRRQKEIGTFIALGMTRSQVIKIFTVEGSAHSIFAIILAAIYGFPLLAYVQKAGIPMPKLTGDMGMSIAEKIIPAYSLGMIFTTTLLVVISATIVSYFPTRRISRMKPTDALRGKLQ